MTGGTNNIPAITSVDLLVADVMIPYQKDGKLEHYVESVLEAKPGEKLQIDKKQFEEISELLEGRNQRAYRGGTSSITLETLGRLSQGDKPHTIIGVTGSDPYSNIIKGSFRKSVEGSRDKSPQKSVIDIHRVGEQSSPETAISFILQYPDKPPTMLTYPGNAEKLLTAETLPWDIINTSKTFYLQGSMRNRFKKEVMDTLLEHRFNTGKTLILAYPNTGFETQKDIEYYDWVTESADVLLSNTDHLLKIFPTENKDASLKKFQAKMREKTNLNLAAMGHSGQTAFITDGANGAYVVTADAIEHVPSEYIGKRNPNMLGEEDTAYAGFLAGHFSQLKPEQSARIAMHLAAAKLEEERPSLQDPRAVLERSAATRELLPRLNNRFSGVGYGKAPEASEYHIG